VEVRARLAVVWVGGTVTSDPSLERLELDPGKRVALDRDPRNARLAYRILIREV
jgi:hypothetical protein